MPSMKREVPGTGDLHLTYRTSRNRRLYVCFSYSTGTRAGRTFFAPKAVQLSADHLRVVRQSE